MSGDNEVADCYFSVHSIGQIKYLIYIYIYMPASIILSKGYYDISHR